MEIKIKNFEDRYKEAVIDFILNIQRYEFQINIDREDQGDLEDIHKNYINDGGQFLIALNKANEVVGTIALVRLSNDNAALKKMFVSKTYRNNKLGKRLLDNLLSSAKTTGIERVFLGTIDKFISAQHFYSNNGFVEIHKSTLPKDFPKLDVDNRFYYKEI